MTRVRLPKPETYDTALSRLLALFANPKACGWEHGGLMHALFYVPLSDWSFILSTFKGGSHAEYRLDWVTHRISWATSCGIVHIEPDPQLGWTDIDLVLRGGLAYEDCIREGEKWMERAVEIREGAAT
jgi:hypothetical protein